MNSYLLFAILAVGLVSTIEMPGSFGHGLGSETMDPVTVGDKQVTLEVGSTTDYDTAVSYTHLTLPTKA